MTPEVSVIVPTFRRPGLLRRCLQSLVQQDVAVSGFEVLVVDDGSADETGGVLAEAEARMPNLRIFRRARNGGPAAARNLGLSHARSPLVLLLDDDIVATPSLISTHVRLQREAGDPQLGILGLVKWHPDLRVTPFMRWVDRSGLQFAYETWIREGPIAPAYGAFYACNLSASRSMLVDAGGFDERFPYPAYEDMELAWRMTERGFRLRHAPEALAYHARAIDLTTFRNRMMRVGESAVLLRAVQPSFPLDERVPEEWVRGTLERAVHRIAAPLARLAGRQPRLERHYRAEIAAAYLAGRRRGRRILAKRGYSRRAVRSEQS